jgi:hypothetical protein
MKDGLAKMGAEPAGLDQRAGKPSYDFQPEVDGLRDLVDRIVAADENDDFNGLSFIREDSLDIDTSDAWEVYNVMSELMDLSRRMRPETEVGRQLETDLKEAVDNLKTSLDSKLGPIEAAKRDPEESYDSSSFKYAIDELEDFFDYYYPTRVTNAMRGGDGGAIGDVRGGGWEASIRFNKETKKWEANMTTPGDDTESYSREFDDQDDAADFVEAQLGELNRDAADYKTRLLSEDGLEALIENYGDDPEKLADILDGISSWLTGTGRRMVENTYREIDKYTARLREIIANNPKA